MITYDNTFKHLRSSNLLLPTSFFSRAADLVELLRNLPQHQQGGKGLHHIEAAGARIRNQPGTRPARTAGTAGWREKIQHREPTLIVGDSLVESKKHPCFPFLKWKNSLQPSCQCSVRFSNIVGSPLWHPKIVASWP